MSEAAATRRNAAGRRLLKVVVTGGPCAGKTTAIAETADRVGVAHGDHWQVFTVAEASSLLYKGRVQRSAMSAAQICQWQADVLATILQLESVYDNIAAEETRRDTLLLCDRGGLDPKAYTPDDDTWRDMLQRLTLTEAQLLTRYDAVIQMHTAPRQFYTSANNPYRRENYEQATAINTKYEALWREHHAYHVVNNYNAHNEADGWAIKSQTVYSIIEGLMLESK